MFIDDLYMHFENTWKDQITLEIKRLLIKKRVFICYQQMKKDFSYNIIDFNSMPQ